MIVVEKVGDSNRLVCKETHEITFKGNFPAETIIEGTVGAVVDLEPGTEVDWWASYGLTVGKCSINDSFLEAEHGELGDHFVCVNSRVVTPQLIVKSSFPEKICSLRVCNIEPSDHIYLINSEMSHTTIKEAGAVIIMESQVRDTMMVGSMTLVRSNVSNFDVFVADVPKTGTIRCGVEEHPMFKSGFILNLVSSNVSDVKISPRASALIAQLSTLKNVELDCDLTAMNTMLNESKITGDMVHMVNSMFGGVTYGVAAPILTIVDHRVMDEQHDNVEFMIITGDHPDKIE